MADLLEKLELLRRVHRVVDDCWYCCPKSGEACGLGERGVREDECVCGADEHNARLDEIISEVRRALGEREVKDG